MSKIHQLPDPSRVEHEASEWIARLDADDVTDDDRERFQAWYAAHPRHAQAYEELAAVVREVRRAGRIVRAVSFGHAMTAASDPSIDMSGGGKRRRSLRLSLAAAAAAAAVAIAATLWMTRGSALTQFQTAIGERASVELPDGSILELNSNSAARVDYTEHARTIHLVRGEAYFEVAHEPERPFWVVAGHSWIRAVGTAFNVDLRPSGVRVIVSEGTVKVAAALPSVQAPSDASLARAPVSVLKAGQQADMKEGIAEIRPVEPLAMARLAAWREGKLYFENQPLETALDELSRYTAARIVIESESLRRLPIGGTFQANARGAEAFLTMLEQGFGLRVRREGADRIYIEEAKQE